MAFLNLGIKILAPTAADCLDEVDKVVVAAGKRFDFAALAVIGYASTMRLV